MPSDILALEIVVHGWPWVILWLESTWRCVLWSSLVVDKRASSIQFSFMCFPCRYVTKTHTRFRFSCSATCYTMDKDQFIMLLFLPIMQCHSALKIYLLCPILCSRTRIVVRVLCHFNTSFHEQILAERLFY